MARRMPLRLENNGEFVSLEHFEEGNLRHHQFCLNGCWRRLEEAQQLAGERGQVLMWIGHRGGEATSPPTQEFSRTSSLHLSSPCKTSFPFNRTSWLAELYKALLLLPAKTGRLQRACPALGLLLYQEVSGVMENPHQACCRQYQQVSLES